MKTIEEKRKAILEQGLRDMANYGVKSRQPDDLPFFDQSSRNGVEEKNCPPSDRELPDGQGQSLVIASESRLPSAARNSPVEEPTRHRTGTVMELERLAEFQGKYLQPLRVSQRKAVYVSEETQKKLDYVVRKIGEQGTSISGYVEQVLREHLDRYKDDVETWRKL